MLADEESPQPQRQQQQPRDGPATVFEADPKVRDIFNTKDGDYFGLVLVAGWPPNPAVMDPPYQEFLDSVRECFEESDLRASTTPSPGQDDSCGDAVAVAAISPSMPPAVYLYPSCHLHITLATFAPPERKDSTKDAIGDHDRFVADYVNLVQEASRRPEWPIEPIQLVVDSTQLGSKAGILLWRDISGTVVRIRECLRNTALERQMEIHAVPGIIHSTFLRFSQIPNTPGDTVQERYKSKVVPRVTTIFDTPVVANTIKLVCESTPYMHIPDDDEHVMFTMSFKIE
jgi:hypothetical protein